MPGSPVHLAFFATEGRIEPRGRVTMLLRDPCGHAIDRKRCRHPEHAFTA